MVAWFSTKQWNKFAKQYKKLLIIPSKNSGADSLNLQLFQLVPYKGLNDKKELAPCVNLKNTSTFEQTDLQTINYDNIKCKNCIIARLFLLLVTDSVTLKKSLYIKMKKAENQYSVTPNLSLENIQYTVKTNKLSQFVNWHVSF